MSDLIRQVELKIADKYSEQKMRCPVHLSYGQEFLPSALSTVVRVKDNFIGTHRSHAQYIAKGGSVKKMISEIYGKETGCSKGRGGSMHLIDLKVNFIGSSAIVGNSIPIGAGLSFADKIKKNNKTLTFIFFGDGAIEEGVFFESINFAAVRKIPAVFICENNFYSVYTSFKDRQPAGREIYKMAKGMGIDSYLINTGDIEKDYNKISKIIYDSRIKQRPVFLEYKTYRYLEHCGPNNDDNLNYRNKKEISYWKKKDVHENLKKLLIEKYKFKLDQILTIERKNFKIVIDAFKYAEKSKFPKSSLALTGLYKSL